jgi:SAM-dependent methyltransferase
MTNKKTFKDLEHAGWREKASVYDDFFAQITNQAIGPLLDAFDDLDGRRLLDVACGTGHLAAAGARRGAEAEGIDFADTMLAKASSSYPDIVFSEGDAQSLSYPDAHFDAVACNFGLIHFENADAAISEAHRVLRKGGKYAFTVWCSPDQDCDFMKLVFGSIQAHGTLDVDLPPAPPIFRFSDDEECVRAVRSVGFLDPEVSRLELKWTANRSEEILELIYKSVVRTPMVLNAQTPEARERIHEAILVGAEAYRSGDKIELGFPAIMTVATKP